MHMYTMYGLTMWGHSPQSHRIVGSLVHSFIDSMGGSHECRSCSVAFYVLVTNLKSGLMLVKLFESRAGIPQEFLARSDSGCSLEHHSWSLRCSWSNIHYNLILQGALFPCVYWHSCLLVHWFDVSWTLLLMENCVSSCLSVLCHVLLRVLAQRWVNVQKHFYLHIESPSVWFSVPCVILRIMSTLRAHQFANRLWSATSCSNVTFCWRIGDEVID